MIGRPLSFEEWAVAVGMEEKTLRRQIEDGKAARELLIKTNINLIKSMAVRLYARQEKNENRLSVDDLVLEGTQGKERGREGGEDGGEMRGIEEV